MSHTIAHRPWSPGHVPWAPILAVLAVVVIAAVVLVVANWPTTTTTPPATTAGVAGTEPAAVSPAVMVGDRAAALTYYKRNYSPNAEFVPAVVGVVSPYPKLPPALYQYKRTHSPTY